MLASDWKMLTAEELQELLDLGGIPDEEDAALVRAEIKERET